MWSFPARWNGPSRGAQYYSCKRRHQFICRISCCLRRTLLEPWGQLFSSLFCFTYSLFVSSVTVQNGSACTVVRAANYSYREWQNWVYQNSENPEPIITKFSTGNYVSNFTPHAKIPQWGRRGKWVKYRPCMVFCFFVNQIFARVPRLNRRSNFNECLIHRMLVTGYCIPRGIKLQEVSIFLFLPKKRPKRVWIGIFKPNEQNIENRISSKLQCRFQPNLA